MIERYDLDQRIITRTPSELMTAPVVARVARFNLEAVEQLTHDVSAAANSGQTVLPVVITSGGGETYCLWAMADLLLSSPVPVATVVLGKAFSCGAILAVCGTKGKRYAAPSATLMIHETSTGLSDGTPSTDAETDAAEAQRLTRRMCEFFDERTEKPAGHFAKLIRERGRTDLYLTAREAKRAGLVDHVRVPTLLTTVRVDTVLT